MKNRFFSILLSVVMVMGMMPSSVFALNTVDTENNPTFSDMPKDWSTTALQNVANNGLLSGYDGEILPKENLTRAQMAAIINRAFGTKEETSLKDYSDVAKTAWYYTDMAKAVQMKIFVGSDHLLNPDSYITREEAFTVLARAFKLSDASEDALDQFADKDLVSLWAEDETTALVSAGFIAGSNGQLNPKQYITRAEFAQLMDNIIKKYIKKAGTYTENIKGNVMINVSGVTLKDMKITGDLMIGDGVGDGDVTLEGVVVTGKTVIRGGGENSIRIIGASSIQNITIERVDGKIRVYTEDGLEIGETIVDGSNDVIIEGDMGTVTVVASDVTVTATRANITSGIVEGNNSKIIVSENSVIKTAEINGENSKIIVEKGSEIEDITVSGKRADISGEGKIAKVKAKADNITVSTPGTKVTATDGVAGVKAGSIAVGEGNTETVPENNENNRNRRSGSSRNESTTSPLASYTAVTLTQTGDIANNNVQYQDAAAVIAALPTEIAVTLVDATVVCVPVTWTDTDIYNPDTAGDYTFTATWGAMPEGADNGNNLTPPTVEVLVEEGIEATPAEYFIFEPSTGTIMGYDIEGGGTDVVIPSTIDGVTVEHIQEGAFSGSFIFKSISIMGGAPSAKLTSVILPDTMISIGDRVFSNHQITSITIPASIMEIGDGAFAENPLDEFIVDPNNNSYASLNGVLFNKDRTTLIQYPREKVGSYSIPKSVTVISDFAFQGCEGLIGVTLPEGLTSIGRRAFSDCSALAGEIVIPDGVTSIEDSTFSGCSELEGVTIGDGVLSIGSSTFNFCSKLTNVTIGSSVESIAGYAFYYCSELTEINIPASVSNIATDVFPGCNKLEAFIVDPANNDFSSLDGVLFNKDRTTLLLYPYAKIGSYEIPDGTISIDQYAFANRTELTHVTFPDSMESIGYLSFASCTGLTEVTIPTGVTSISNLAFYGTSITRLTLEQGGIDIGGSAFPRHSSFETAYETGGAGTYMTGEYNSWVKAIHIYQLATSGDATILDGADISFSHHDSLEGISHTGGAAAITIDTAGTYRIDYCARTSAAIEAEIAIAVNGVVDDTTSIPITSGIGSVQLSLNAGDVITLRNNSAVSITLELSPQIGAEMHIVKKN